MNKKEYTITLIIILSLMSCSEIERQMNPLGQSGRPIPSNSGSGQPNADKPQTSQNRKLDRDTYQNIRGYISYDGRRAAKTDVSKSRSKSASRHKPYIYAEYKKNLNQEEMSEMYGIFCSEYNKVYDQYKPDHDVRMLKQF